MNDDNAIKRMGSAGAKDSLPKDGMFDTEQLDAMLAERIELYERIAKVMLEALLIRNELPTEDTDDE